MEKRDDVLREALTTNANEKARWTNYKAENEIAIANLNEFSKHLAVNVMVPIGRFALMSGQLIHTNEVLVAHYQGYFSKCSAHKAKEICDLRIRNAEDYLKKLEEEEELFRNKLEAPQLQGALPALGQNEIIEEYDEEKEKVWRERHKLMVKKDKMKERKERESNHKNTLDESAKLDEELEYFDEHIAQDLEATNELVHKLMSCEIKTTTKQRISHVNRDNHNTEEKPTDQEEQNARVVQKADLNVSTPRTNNNTLPNPEITLPAPDEVLDGNDDMEDEVQEVSDEARLIMEQAKFLKTADQIGFYEYQIQIIQQKLSRMPLDRNKDIEEKIKLIDLIDCLQQLLEAAEDAAEAENEEEKCTELNAECHNTENQDTSSTKEQKRRISFSTEIDTLEFQKNETIMQMTGRIVEKKKSISKNVNFIDDNQALSKENQKTPEQIEMERRELIAQKVNKNLEFVSENQSHLDCHLIDAITQSSEPPKTLKIHFKHSEQSKEINKSSTKNAEDMQDNEKEVLGSPADIYEHYLQSLRTQSTQEPQAFYVDGYEGEDEVKVPTLGENYRELAYEDPRKKFSQDANDQNKEEEGSNLGDKSVKSILRNKDAVMNETRNTAMQEQIKNINLNKKKKKMQKEETYMSAYNKVMHDVVEKPDAKPDPLPAEKFVDMHAPKKRISHFKQSRIAKS